MKPDFFYSQIQFRLEKPVNHKRWIRKVIEREGKKTGRLDVIFAEREFVRSLNRQFLSHNYETDVIAFDYSKGNHINGEIYISINNVFENAVFYSVEAELEVRRVMVHGVLHLCGYNDGDDNEKSIMTKMEERYLKLFECEFLL